MGIIILSCLIIGISLSIYNNYLEGIGKENTPPKAPKKGWKKVVEFDGGTEYHDHDGMVYTMYDMKMNPGFKNAKL